MNIMDAGQAVVDPLPEDLETMTIAQLKKLGADRGYSVCWLEGKKKADYLKWIRNQHEDAVTNANAEVAHQQLFDDMKANLEGINRARKDAAEKVTEFKRQLGVVSTVIAQLDSRPEKTVKEYEALVVALKSKIALNEGIAKCESIIGARV